MNHFEFPTYITLPNKKNTPLPEKFAHDDVRFPESFVTYILERFSEKNHVILDPFAGLGTTMIVSEALERISYGIECDKEKTDYIKSNISHKKHVFNVSALDISSLNLPKADLCLTSPPYMNCDETVNPLTQKESTTAYKDYLSSLNIVFSQIQLIMKKQATIIIEVSNLKKQKVTPLAWDIHNILTHIFTFQGEIVICWEGDPLYSGEGQYGYGYDHSYCLIYKN